MSRGLLVVLLAAAPANATVLPPGLGQVNFNSGVGITTLIVHGFNFALGIFGVVLMGVAIIRILQIIWAHWRGSESKYQLGFLGGNSRMPPVLSAILDVMVGFVILGLVLTGSWVNIVDGLLGVGSHVGNYIGNTISNAHP